MENFSDLENFEKNINSYICTLESIISDKSEKNKFTPKKFLQNNTKESIKSEINIVILGDSEVGKSSFAIHYLRNKFEQYHVATIGLENFQTSLNCNYTKYILNFIITSGIVQYRVDYTSYFEAANFFLIF